MTEFDSKFTQKPRRGDSEDRGLRQAWDVVDHTSDAMGKMRKMPDRTELLRMPKMTSENRTLFENVLDKIDTADQRKAEETAAIARRQAAGARDRLKLDGMQMVPARRAAGSKG